MNENKTNINWLVMYDTILDIAKDNLNKTIIITSHIVAIRAFLCKIMNIPLN